jgi:hypothetical protein
MAPAKLPYYVFLSPLWIGLLDDAEDASKDCAKELLHLSGPICDQIWCVILTEYKELK